MSRISEAAREKMREGGRQRAQAFDSDYQRRVGARQPIEARRAAGKKGYAALVAKYGADYAQDQTAKWRRNNPTPLELKVAALLAEAGEAFEREAKLESGLYVDFRLERGQRVIEADGNGWHRNGSHCVNREELDAAKDERVRSLGFQVLRLTGYMVENDSAREHLRQFLEQNQCQSL